MATVFNNAKSSLSAAVTISATTFPITDIGAFLAVGGSGDFFYAQLVDAKGNYEVVKVDVGNSTINGLSVTRGQGGSAKAWPAGTQIWNCIDAVILGIVNQEGIARSVAFNPNSALTPAYKGEKVYQSDDVLWWKSIDAITQEWRLIAGVVYVADVTFDPAAGTYGNGQTLTMSCVTPGVTIRYTTDGSEPTASSTAYSAPITIPSDSTVTYKAKAFGANRWESPSQNTTTGVYTTVGAFTGETKLLAATGKAPRKPQVWNPGAGDRVYITGAAATSVFYSWDFAAGAWTTEDDSWPAGTDSAYARGALVKDGNLYVIGAQRLLQFTGGNLVTVTNAIGGLQYMGWVQNNKIHMGCDLGAPENFYRHDGGLDYTLLLDVGANPIHGVVYNNNFYWLNTSNLRLYKFDGTTNVQVAPPGVTNSSWEEIKEFGGVIYAAGKHPNDTSKDGICYWNGVDNWSNLFYVEEPPHNMDGNIGPFEYVAAHDTWYFYSGTNLNELYKWKSGEGFTHITTSEATNPMNRMFQYNGRLFGLSETMELVEIDYS